MPAGIAQSTAPLVREDHNGLATLTLNRPGQVNALSSALISALQRTLDTIARDASVQVVIQAGAGTALCAGRDLRELRALPERDSIRAVFHSYSGC